MSNIETVNRPAVRVAGVPDLSSLPDDALLTNRQKALLTGFSTQAFKKWRRKGRGPATICVEGPPQDYRSRLPRLDRGRRQGLDVMGKSSHREPEPPGSRTLLAQPQPGTILERRVDHLRASNQFDPSEFASANDVMREIIMHSAMADADTASELPIEVLRELRVRQLRPLGLPADTSTPALQLLLDDHVENYLRKFGRQPFRSDATGWRWRGDAAHSRTAILATYVDMLPALKGETDNRAFESVASRLSGCDRHAVRRVVRPFRRTMGGLPEAERNLAILALIKLADILNGLDKRSSQRDPRPPSTNNRGLQAPSSDRGRRTP